MAIPTHPRPICFRGVDAVVHLAGASIAGRFTEEHKAAIRDSRIEPTRRLAEAAVDSDDGPEAFVSASAIGIYGYDRGDALLCEDSVRGDGFLADVVADWEAATATRRRRGPADGQRAHRDRAGGGGRHAATAAAAVPCRPRRPVGQR